MYNTRYRKNLEEIRRNQSKNYIVDKMHLSKKNKHISTLLSNFEREQRLIYERMKPLNSINPNSIGLEYEVPLLTMKKTDYFELQKNSEYSKNIMSLTYEDSRETSGNNVYIEFVSKPMNFDNLQFIENETDSSNSDDCNDYEWFKKENKCVRIGSINRKLGQRSKFRFIEHIKYYCRTYFNNYNIKDLTGTPQITFGIELKRFPKLYREVCNLMNKTDKNNRYIDYYVYNKYFIKTFYYHNKSVMVNVDYDINNSSSNFIGFIFLCMHYISIFDSEHYSDGKTDNNTGMKGSPYLMTRFSFTYIYENYLNYDEKKLFRNFSENFDYYTNKIMNKTIKMSMHLHTKKHIKNNYFETLASNFLRSIYDVNIGNIIYNQFIKKFNQGVVDNNWKRHIFDKNHNVHSDPVDDFFIPTKEIAKDIFSPPLGELYPDGDVFYKYEYENMYEINENGDKICKNSMGTYEYNNTLNKLQRDSKVILLECRRLTPRHYTIKGFDETLTMIHEHIKRIVINYN